MKTNFKILVIIIKYTLAVVKDTRGSVYKGVFWNAPILNVVK